MKLKKMKKESIVQHILERWEKLQTARAPYEAQWKRYYDIYRLVMDPKERAQAMADGRSNLFIPYCFGIVETVKPRVITTMFAARPYVGLIALNGSEQEKAEIHTNLVDYQLNHKMTFIRTASNAVTSALIYGTGITKQTWKYEVKNRKRREPVLENGFVIDYTVKKEEVITYDDPNVRHVDIFDFWADPAIDDIQKQRDCIERYFRSEEELEEMCEALGVDFKKISKQLEKGEEHNNTGVRQRLLDLGLGVDDANEDIEVLEYWTSKEFVIVLNRKLVLVVDEIPYWHGKKPYSRLVDIEVPGELYGIGEIEPVEYLQYELNTTRNQRMDNVNLIINRMYKILRGANIDPDQLISRPGGFIEVDSMDDIKEMEFKDVTQSAYREEDVIKNDMDHTNGVYDYAKGASPTRRETATTATILAEASNERFKLKIKLMEDTWLLDVASQIVELNRQYIDYNRLVVLRRDYQTYDVEVTPEDIDIPVEMMAVGSAVDPVFNKAMRQQALMQLTGVLAQMPFVKTPELVKKMLMSFDIRDVHNIIDPDMVQMMEMQQKMMAQQALMQAQMPPSPPSNPPASGATPPQASATAGQMPPQAVEGTTGGADPRIAEIIAQMPPAVQQLVSQLPPEITQDPKALMAFLVQMVGGGQGA